MFFNKSSDNLPYEKVGKDVRCIADEIPFEIPDSWEWVRLGEVFQHNTGKALNSSNREGKLLKYITTSNLYWDRFEISTMKEMLFTDAELDKCTVRQGDLLVFVKVAISDVPQFGLMTHRFASKIIFIGFDLIVWFVRDFSITYSFYIKVLV